MTDTRSPGRRWARFDRLVYGSASTISETKSGFETNRLEQTIYLRSRRGNRLRPHLDDCARPSTRRGSQKRQILQKETSQSHHRSTKVSFETPGFTTGGGSNWGLGARLKYLGRGPQLPRSSYFFDDVSLASSRCPHFPRLPPLPHVLPSGLLAGCPVTHSCQEHP